MNSVKNANYRICKLNIQIVLSRLFRNDIFIHVKPVIHEICMSNQIERDS